VVDQDGPKRMFFPDCPAQDGLEDATEVLCLLFGTTYAAYDEEQVVLFLKASREIGFYRRVGLAAWRDSSFESAQVKSVVKLRWCV
jgi:hypothetical protein